MNLYNVCDEFIMMGILIAHILCILIQIYIYAYIQIYHIDIFIRFVIPYTSTSYKS
jgi:hypothetical protein